MSAQGEHTKDQSGVMEVKVESTYVCTLRDLGLCQSQGGIPSPLNSQQEAEAYARHMRDAIVAVDDPHHLACIDGRITTCEADGSPALNRLRVAGASVTIEVMAFLGQTPIVEALPEDVPLAEKIDTIDDYVAENLGIKPCSHEGGCGCAAHQLAILKSMGRQQNADATRAVVDAPYVQELTGFFFSGDRHNELQERIPSLVTHMEAEGWDGNLYVEHKKQQDSNGVETLATDDSPFHGHKEQVIAIVVDLRGDDRKRTIGKKKLVDLGLGEAFVVNVNAIHDSAKGLAGPDNEPCEVRAFQAGISEQIGTASVLCNENMPVVFVVIR